MTKETIKIDRDQFGVPLDLGQVCDAVNQMMPPEFYPVIDPELSMAQKRADNIWFLAIVFECRRRAANKDYKRMSEIFDDLENKLMTGWRPKND